MRFPVRSRVFVASATIRIRNRLGQSARMQRIGTEVKAGMIGLWCGMTVYRHAGVPTPAASEAQP